METIKELEELERQKKELEKRINALKKSSVNKGNVRISRKMDKYDVSFALDTGDNERHMSVLRYATKDEMLTWVNSTWQNLQDALKEV